MSANRRECVLWLEAERRGPRLSADWSSGVRRCLSLSRTVSVKCLSKLSVKIIFGNWAPVGLGKKSRSVSGVPRNFVQGVVQQIQVRTEDIEKGDLEAVAP